MRNNTNYYVRNSKVNKSIYSTVDNTCSAGWAVSWVLCLQCTGCRQFKYIPGLIFRAKQNNVKNYKCSNWNIFPSCIFLMVAWHMESGWYHFRCSDLALGWWWGFTDLAKVLLPTALLVVHNIECWEFIYNRYQSFTVSLLSDI